MPASSPDLIVLALIATATIAAAAIDMRVRRVPNVLTMPLAAIGVLVAAAGLGRVGVLAALAGAGVGLLVMLPGYLFGATGAGDVKLFAALGTLLGPGPTVRAFVVTAIAGGTLALLVAARRRRLRQTLDATASLVATGGRTAPVIEDPSANNRFAYAPAIAIGTLLVALGL